MASIFCYCSQTFGETKSQSQGCFEIMEAEEEA